MGKGKKRKNRANVKNNQLYETHQSRKSENLLNAEDKCKTRLLKDLQQLKNIGLLSYSLDRSTNEFEVLEFYGDSVLYERTSKYIMTTRRFFNPHLMTQLRTQCVRNNNLARVFDTLGLQTLVPQRDIDDLKMNLKARADVVEAILGELAEKRCENALSQLLSFIMYVGEAAFELSPGDYRYCVSSMMMNMYFDGRLLSLLLDY
eukprot:TRINITY_DN2839_c0_g1_i1.p1 TRINITY_DN2839_c0_g1~~TRINITY_DN2839_c0_g1_i1.p1  ORF type:complete len:204 (-),score=32.11 TRINITY_DN2839_c0_g1_i1:14-625(-)